MVIRRRIQRCGFLGLMILATGAASYAEGTGAATYKAKCQMCHGATGAGETPAGKAMKVAPFKKGTKAEMIAVITKGKGKMPAYSTKLTPDQIEDVAGYIHSSLLK